MSRAEMERQWRRRSPGLPTYRFVSYHAAAGAFGPEHQHRGSGHRQFWSLHEFDKLRAINTVSEDLRALGLTMTTEIVKRLWELLDQASGATIRRGSVAITATITEQEQT